MVSVKPWRAEALVRLALGVAVCVFMGVLGMSLLRFRESAATVSIPLFAAIVAAGFLAFATALILTRKPWHIEESRVRLMVFLAVLYLGLALVGVAQKLTHSPSTSVTLWQMVLASLSFQGAALILIGCFLSEHQLGWSEGFGFRNEPARALGLGLLATLAVLPMAWLLQMSVAVLLTWFHVEAESQAAIQVLRDAPGWLDRLPLGLVAIVIAPPAEEMLFRGLLYPTVKRAGFPRLALWGTALLFAAIHWNLPSFPSLVLLALVLTWLYEKTDNLLAPIVTHGLFNALNFVALQLYEQLPEHLR